MKKLFEEPAMTAIVISEQIMNKNDLLLKGIIDGSIGVVPDPDVPD